jgi:hypothetical protein
LSNLEHSIDNNDSLQLFSESSLPTTTSANTVFVAPHHKQSSNLSSSMQNIYYHHQLLLYQSQLQQQQQQLPQQLMMAGANREKLRGYSVPNLGGLLNGNLLFFFFARFPLDLNVFFFCLITSSCREFCVFFLLL